MHPQLSVVMTEATVYTSRLNCNNVEGWESPNTGAADWHHTAGFCFNGRHNNGTNATETTIIPLTRSTPMTTRIVTLSFVLTLFAGLSAAAAGSNELSKKEKKAGWKLLFNGKNADGWICNNGKQPSETVIENGTLMPYKSGGYVLMYEKPFSDFILKCEVKMPEKCNSGIFFRVGNPKNPVQTGFEVQVLNSKGNGRHDFGAIYDLVAPKKNNLKPTGEWNAVEIKAVGPKISVKVNGEKVAEINTEKWTEPGRRPDGSKHKFKKAIADFPRKGYLGFQDHGHKVWFRNVKLLDLSRKK